MILVGVDPDLSGGIVCVDPDLRAMHLARSMPTWQRPLIKGRRIDAEEIFRVFRKCRDMGAEYAVIEKAAVMHQKSSKGIAMMGGIHTTHQTYGGLWALAATVWGKTRVIDAVPSVWKKQMDIGSDKGKARQMAMAMYPSMTPLLSQKNRTGISEAILLVHWGRLKCT